MRISDWSSDVCSSDLFRRNCVVNAFSEGWAEYAATLAGEMGLYDNPYDRYGRLSQDAFLTCRLVVDTGMNTLGWTWEQAKQYMREHTRSEEHTSELQSLMRISYAVFCLKKKK